MVFFFIAEQTKNWVICVVEQFHWSYFRELKKKLILYDFKLKAKKIKYDMEFLMDSNNFFEINVFSMRQNERD